MNIEELTGVSGSTMGRDPSPTMMRVQGAALTMAAALLAFGAGCEADVNDPGRSTHPMLDGGLADGRATDLGRSDSLIADGDPVDGKSAIDGRVSGRDANDGSSTDGSSTDGAEQTAAWSLCGPSRSGTTGRTRSRHLRRHPGQGGRERRAV